MAIPKVMGIETEYGITVKNQADFNPILSSLLLINSYETYRSSRIRWDYEAESPLRDARGFEYMEDKEVLYFKDFSSGAMIESVVRRAKKLALKRYIQNSEKGIKVEDLLNAVREEFKENEDLPNTTNPDDWAKIAGKKGERIASVKSLTSEPPAAQKRNVEKIVTTGQYL